MARARIDDDLGRAALTTMLAIAESNGIDQADGPALAASVDRATLALVVRYTLQLLAEQAPGGRVPRRDRPHGAHRRGAECVVDACPSHDSILPHAAVTRRPGPRWAEPDRVA